MIPDTIDIFDRSSLPRSDGWSNGNHDAACGLQPNSVPYMDYILNHLSVPIEYPKPSFFPHFSLLPGPLLSGCNTARQVFLLIKPVIPGSWLPTDLSILIVL